MSFLQVVYPTEESLHCVSYLYKERSATIVVAGELNSKATCEDLKVTPVSIKGMLMRLRLLCNKECLQTLL